MIPRTASDPTTIAKQLLESWKDHDYRIQFVRERVQSSVALQIRALREQRNGMTQTELGRRMGKAQPWISQIENPDYGKWSISTLLDCADAFDSDLEIRFRPFSRSLYELSHQNEQYFEVPSFEEELPELEKAAIHGWIATGGKWTDLDRAKHLLHGSQNAVPNAYVQSAQSTSPMGLRDSSPQYQMSPGPEILSRLKVWNPSISSEEGANVGQDKRRRGPKGTLKRTAA